MNDRLRDLIMKLSKVSFIKPQETLRLWKFHDKHGCLICFLLYLENNDVDFKTILLGLHLYLNKGNANILLKFGDFIYTKYGSMKIFASNVNPIKSP